MAAKGLERLALFAGRHYRQIFIASVVLAALCLWSASRIRFDTDVLGLLPKHDPAVETLRATLEDFGSLDFLLIVLRIPSGAAIDPYESFVDALGPRLLALDHFDEVDYKIGEIEELLEDYLPRSLLFIDHSALEAIAARTTDEGLRERAREIRRLISTPQGVILKNLVQLDPLGISDAFLGRLGTPQGGLAIDFTSGYLLSQDREMLLMLAKPKLPPHDVDFSRAMVEDVERVIAEAQAEWPDILGVEDGPPPPEPILAGRYVIALGDESANRKDFLINIGTSMTGVLLLFLFAFRRFGPLLYAFVPLSYGLVLTFGFAGAAWGALSAATSGVAALLIGLGIDFVIVSYGRYVEERKTGGDLLDAIRVMSGSSGRAVVVGGVTSGATFYAFMVTDFTGLRQMGMLAGTGILLCMIAVLVLLPTMLAWNEQRHDHRVRDQGLFLHGLGSAGLMRTCMRHPKIVLVLAAILTAAAATQAVQIEFNDSVRAMRPEGSTAVSLRDEVQQRFSSGFDQMMLVTTGDDLDQVLDTAHRAAAGAQALVREGVLAGQDSIASLIPAPSHQQEVLAWLEEKRANELDMERIERTFRAELAAEGLRAEPFERGLALFSRAVSMSEPLGVEEVRSVQHGERLLERYLRHTDDGWKSVVYMFPPPTLWRREPPPQVVDLVESLGPGSTLAAANVVSQSLRKRILRDATIAAILGYVVVGFLLWLDFRRLRETILSLAPLTVGIVWMLGAMGILGFDMNFMNIFVTTMIIGIGVDYGIHVIHRFRETRGKTGDAMEEDVVETGKAIALAAASTIVGLGSLSLSSYPGLRSMGQVAILGALCTCLVALTVLPAYLSLVNARHSADDNV